MTAGPVRATVVVPTHDHGPLLMYSAHSALSQTVKELEVFIIGDGVADETRSAARDLQAEDERVRFFDNPKGPRHGEVHRHAALGEARGRIVCYLSDDDLWFPNHIETMDQLLEVTDFAHTLPASVLPDGTVQAGVGDLAVSEIRGRMTEGWNFVPLSCGGHTLDAYRRLPFGWRTTPEGTYTDLYMWQQFLAKPDCRCLSSSKLTVLHFPSPLRPRFSPEQREGELAAWAGRLQEAQPAVVEAALDHYARECLRHHLALGDRDRRIDVLEAAGSEAELAAIALGQLHQDLESCRQHLEEQAKANAEARAEADQRQHELDRATQDRAAYEAELRRFQALAGELQEELQRERRGRTSVEQELGAAYATVSWRLRQRLLTVPAARRAVQLIGAARARARGAAR